MEVPVGFIAKLWSFISFLPFFFLLFILGLIKAAIIGPVVVAIILVGNSAVILGLWPAHFVWTYYCVAKSKRLGLVFKILVMVLLPVPLVLWPIIGILGSLLGGIGYGIFAPLIATFEAAGQNVADKFFHCFVYQDGCLSTLEGSCTVERDFTDFCFHSYFSYMDDLSEEMPPDEKPMDIKLSKFPSCLLVTLLAVPVDVLLITAVAFWKSPYMLFKGWKRLLEDLIGREGPFLETVCVPFAGLAIILWPLAVVGAVISAFVSSFFLGLYAGVIVHQEDSLRMGLAYVVAVVSLFDEYTNDLLYLKEGSCFPRPRYRRNMRSSKGVERRNSIESDKNDQKNGREGSYNSKLGREGSYNSKLVSERSRTLKWAIQQYTPIQVWDWLFKSCEVNGRQLLRDGLIDIKDIEDCVSKGKCKKLGIKLPAWCILQCLLASAKSDSSGLVISDGVELTRSNWPRDKMFEWFIGPLLIMKEQIKGLQLDEHEESCLRKLIMECKNEKPEEWNDTEFPSSDTVRRAQLQAIIRRIDPIYILKETKDILTMSYRISSRAHQSITHSQPQLAQKITDDLASNKPAQSTVACVYQTHIAGDWRNVTVLWCKNLMNHSLCISVDSVETDFHHSCKIDLKPWHFWNKKGFKTFEVDGNLVEVYWDLRMAKFSGGGGPEPCADFYVALVSDEEVVLLLGDYKKKAYKRTKSRPALVEARMFYKKEHVFGKRSFSTRAKFDQSRKEHEIVVESSTSGPKDPEMWISIDGIVLIHIQNLHWKFRGNQTLLIDNLPLQVYWDVHAWLFSNSAGSGTGHGLFIFKPETESTDRDESSCGGDDSECGSGNSNYYSTQSHSKASEFCLFLYARKLE